MSVPDVSFSAHDTPSDASLSSSDSAPFIKEDVTTRSRWLLGRKKSMVLAIISTVALVTIVAIGAAFTIYGAYTGAFAFIIPGGVSFILSLPFFIATVIFIICATPFLNKVPRPSITMDGAPLNNPPSRAFSVRNLKREISTVISFKDQKNITLEAWLGQEARFHAHTENNGAFMKVHSLIILLSMWYSMDNYNREAPGVAKANELIIKSLNELKDDTFLECVRIFSHYYDAYVLKKSRAPTVMHMLEDFKADIEATGEKWTNIREGLCKKDPLLSSDFLTKI